tara:strand:- start:7 stop:348 length:342 start_codon:yes stop_codon:yes gene_type:complete
MSKHIGQVKWFNNKIGYGFITILNESESKDIFVHHANIKPMESNYRTLKIGEFVEFELDNNCEGQHNEQAVNVTGICGKELQCDWVHRLNKKRRFSKKDDDKKDEGEDEQTEQ